LEKTTISIVMSVHSFSLSCFGLKQLFYHWITSYICKLATFCNILKNRLGIHILFVPQDSVFLIVIAHSGIFNGVGRNEGY
jgi:hypothetical protein